jgi:hypothetical protein
VSQSDPTENIKQSHHFFAEDFGDLVSWHENHQTKTRQQ